MITETKFIEEALQLRVEVAAIKAVAHVEGKGKGFGLNGKPLILFEPHIFWRELVKRGIDPLKYAADPKYSAILYKSWGTKPYPQTQAVRYAQLDLATTINRDAALSSCSWGAFQILGRNWKACGCKTLQEFINKVWKGGENGHLDLFTEYITTAGLVKHLRNKHFKLFAEGYNGKLYWKHNYDGQMEEAYTMFSKN